jgi:virulence-associated protein VapD
MKHLKTFEGLFSIFKRKKEGEKESHPLSRPKFDRDILKNCKDMILELEDMDYDVQVTSTNNKLYIRCVKKIRPEKRSTLYRLMVKEDVYEKEVKPVFGDISRYLEEEGFYTKIGSVDYIEYNAVLELISIEPIYDRIVFRFTASNKPINTSLGTSDRGPR